MRSIPVAISGFSGNNFKGFYLKKEKFFFDFLLHFWNVLEIWNIPKRKKSILALLLPKLLIRKEMLT